LVATHVLGMPNREVSVRIEPVPRTVSGALGVIGILAPTHVEEVPALAFASS